MRTVALALVFLLASMGLPAWAQDDANSDLDAELEALLSGEQEVQVHQFPEIAPEFRLSVGYMGIDHDGSESAAKYECLDCSITYGAEARVFSYPHRAYFVFDSLGEDDYFGELRYAWRDKLFIRGVNRSLFHNLERARLIDLNTVTANPGVIVRDKGEDYGVHTSIGMYSARLKAPNFAAHAFASLWNFHKDGDEQQRHLLGSGWHNDIQRASTKRDVEFNTDIATAGANTHFGPIEAEYIHQDKRFKPGGDEVMTDAYTAAGVLRDAGTYRHDAIAETEGTSQRIKLHTSYTGKWVSSATIAVKERKNVDSDAKSDSFVGSIGIRWMPETNLSFVATYRHSKNSVDNPARVTISDTAGVNSYTFDVKESISSTSNYMSLTARYRPVQKLTLKAKYAYETIERDNAEDWGIQDETKKTTVSASAGASLPGSLKANIQYTFRKVEDPAYNIEPDFANDGSVALNWNPAQGLHTFASYDVVNENRRYLEYSDTNKAENRHHHRSRFMVGGTVIGQSGASVSLSYARLLNHIEQDMVVYELATPTIDKDVSYNDEADSYTVAVAYMYKSAVAVAADVTHTRSKGGYDAGGTLGATESYAEMDFQETSFTASADYTFNSKTTTGVEYRYIERNDTEQNPYDKLEGGDVHVAMVRLTQEW